jgi:DNA-directed RNA polymerase beta subunit
MINVNDCSALIVSRLLNILRVCASIDGASMQDIDGDIGQEDSWAVISAYFEEKGLVRQQLDSFDEFMQTSAQEIVAESPDLLIKPQRQYAPDVQNATVQQV